MFPTTRWSAILGAKSDDEPLRRRSWDALVLAYWRPVFKHLRAAGKSREDAEDLTQAFFAHALERELVATYDAERGRFRTFLRVCLDRFAANDAKANARLKRGGGTIAVSLDFDAAEAEIALSNHESPSDVFDREWRRSIFSAAIDELRAECERTERRAHFEIFERYDLADDRARPTYDELARAFDVPATTITNRLAGMRRELRRLVLAKLEEITASDDELRRETRVLFGRNLR